MIGTVTGPGGTGAVSGNGPAAGVPSRLPDTLPAWRALLDRIEVRPSKGMGQNFLLDRSVIGRIVAEAEIGPGDTVVEIGPGLGILSEGILATGAHLTAIELDAKLAAQLFVTFGDLDRFRLVEADALSVATETLVPGERPFTVVANLPYSVATAILRHLLEQSHRPRRLVLMVQKEVAERITATPPRLSILGVAARLYTEPRIAFTVPPDVFFPPPAVESAVVVLDVHDRVQVEGEERALFFTIVSAGFQQKRKQLANSLADTLALPKAEVVTWLGAAGIAPDRRAQTLSVPEWLAVNARRPASIVSRR